VDERHAQVQENGVDLRGCCLSQSCLGIERRTDIVAFELQHATKCLCRRRIIVDDENGGAPGLRSLKRRPGGDGPGPGEEWLQPRGRAAFGRLPRPSGQADLSESEKRRHFRSAFAAMIGNVLQATAVTVSHGYRSKPVADPRADRASCKRITVRSDKV